MLRSYLWSGTSSGTAKVLVKSLQTGFAQLRFCILLLIFWDMWTNLLSSNRAGFGFLWESITHTSLVDQFTLWGITVLWSSFTRQFGLLRIRSLHTVNDTLSSHQIIVVSMCTLSVVHSWDRRWYLQSIIGTKWSSGPLDIGGVKWLVSKVFN